MFIFFLLNSVSKTFGYTYINFSITLQMGSIVNLIIDFWSQTEMTGNGTRQ